VTSALVASRKHRMETSPPATKPTEISNQTKIITITMTQSRQPDDRSLDRTLRSFDRRISRLEDTQVTWRELNDAFDRVYEEIDELKVEMNQRFAQVEARFDQLEARFDQLEARFDRFESRFDRFESRFGELERKFDIVMRHITGQGN